jgi:hypothetical protein
MLLTKYVAIVPFVTLDVGRTRSFFIWEGVGLFCEGFCIFCMEAIVEYVITKGFAVWTGYCPNIRL